jgi:hypothetical protein
VTKTGNGQTVHLVLLASPIHCTVVFVSPFSIHQLFINENVITFLHSSCTVECKKSNSESIRVSRFFSKGDTKSAVFVRYYSTTKNCSFLTTGNSLSIMPRKQGLVGRQQKKRHRVQRTRKSLNRWIVQASFLPI